MAVSSAGRLKPSSLLSCPEPLRPLSKSQINFECSLARCLTLDASSNHHLGPKALSVGCHSNDDFSRFQPFELCAWKGLNRIAFRPKRRRPFSNPRLHFNVRVSSELNGLCQLSYPTPESSRNFTWDIVGLGQAMVDFSGAISDEVLINLQLEKGKRKVVNHEERGNVLSALDGKAYKVSAGGSLSNTLVALARLGNVPTFPSHYTAGNDYSTEKPGKLHVAMVGSVGSDPLGEFYRAKLLRANVHFLSKAVSGGTTGTVVVLTTPDAQRTMLSYQGMSSVIQCDNSMEGIISSSKLLVVEGYLWEIPQTVEAIAKACLVAKQNSVMVALTASDVTCVLRHRLQFLEVMRNSADVLFANADEARALAGLPQNASPALAAQILGSICPLVSVTDGAQGAYIALNCHVSHVPPHHCEALDTCGAGDAFAAGILFGLSRGIPDVKSMGALASTVASVVVSQQGARLKEEDAERIVRRVDFDPSPLLDGPIVKAMQTQVVSLVAS